MSFLVISCSLNQRSRSRLLAFQAVSNFKELDVSAELLDLVETELPFCDGETTYELEAVQVMGQRIRDAEGILLATPIYNYDANAAAKNLIELTGRAWEEKVVGFLCAAGGQGSYMSIMSLANSLMLDFRCIVLPRFVYATGHAFQDNQVMDTEIKKRIQKLCEMTIHISSALNS